MSAAVKTAPVAPPVVAPVEAPLFTVIAHSGGAIDPKVLQQFVAAIGALQAGQRLDVPASTLGMIGATRESLGAALRAASCKIRVYAGDNGGVQIAKV